MRRIKKYTVRETYKGTAGVFDTADDLPYCECSTGFGDGFQRAHRIARLLNADYHVRRVTAARKRQNKLKGND